MKKLIVFLAVLLLGIGAAHAQRHYSQAELDALLAPVALQPDPVLSQLLMAATYPDDVAAAARWSRANPQLHGDDAVRAVEGQPWDASVKSLVAYPDLLARMAESPQWLGDLGDAFLVQQAQVMDTVQGLRRRAQANGQLVTTDQTAVYAQGEVIVVQPRTQFVYVSYYDPYVVYGPWWWPHYHPVFWRPWVVRPVFVAHFHSHPDWHHHHIRVRHGQWHHPRHPVTRHPVTHAPHARPPQAGKPHVPAHNGKPHVPPHNGKPPHNDKPHVRVPESQRRPIVQSTPPRAIHHSTPPRQPTPAANGFPPRQPMPAANGFSHPRSSAPGQQAQRREHRALPQREQRFEPRSEPRGRAQQQRGQRG